jgi:hypothetical protein
MALSVKSLGERLKQSERLGDAHTIDVVIEYAEAPSHFSSVYHILAARP